MSLSDRITNEDDFAPVSFIRDGYQDSDQVHLGGTYAFLPKHLDAKAKDGKGPGSWDAAEQRHNLVGVYWEAGIAPGFAPASTSYLADTGAEARVQSLVDDRVASRRAPAPTEPPTPLTADGSPPEPVSEHPLVDDSADAPADLGEDDTTTDEAPGLPWPDVESLSLDDIRERLAAEPEGSPLVDAFVDWELSRPKPRVTILRELGVEGF